MIAKVWVRPLIVTDFTPSRRRLYPAIPNPVETNPYLGFSGAARGVPYLQGSPDAEERATIATINVSIGLLS